MQTLSVVVPLHPNARKHPVADPIWLAFPVPFRGHVSCTDCPIIFSRSVVMYLLLDYQLKLDPKEIESKQ